jgi:hypothetical protein
MAVSAQGADADDLDSFFEGDQEDIEIAEPVAKKVIVDEPMFDEAFGADATEESEEQPRIPKLVYPPPVPAPVFESSTEMYMYYGRKYIMEICLILIAIVYFVNIFVGKKVNAKLVSMWLAEALPLLKENFHHLGFGEEPNLSLSQIKYHEFEFFASGRDNCHYAFMNLRTKRRQDVICGGILGVIWPETDRLILDIPIDSDLPLEILVVRSHNVKRTQQEMPNINRLVEPMKKEQFSKTKLTPMAESGETVDAVFTKKFSNALEKYEKYLEFLHVTDQRVYTNYPLVLKAEILLGDTPAEYKNSVDLVKTLLELVDHIAKNVKLSAKSLEKASKLREVEEKKKNKVR